MRKNIAMLLCLVMVLSVALCGCSSEADALVGTWTATIDLADALNEELAADEEIGPYIQVSSFSLVYTMTFTSEDTYSMTVDETALSGEFEAMKAEVEAGLYSYLDAMIEAEGLSMTADELLALSNMSMADLLDEALSEDMITGLVDELNMEGNFEAKDGKLFLSDGLEYSVDQTMYELYTLAGSTLTIDAGTASGADEMSQYIFPMVFTKAA